MPLGLSSRILDDPREATRFDGFASVHRLKSDAEVCLLDRIRDKPNVTISAGRPVRTLLGDDTAPHRITGVVTADGVTLKARSVLLAAGALSSPQLLANYLATSGLADKLPCALSVGRNFKRHLLTAVVAWSPSRKGDLLRKTIVLTHDRFPHSSVQPLGAALTEGDSIATELPSFAPRWIADFVGERAYGFFLQTEDGSHPDNRVIAAIGAGRPRLDYDRDRIALSRDEHRRFVRAFAFDLLRAGMIPIVKSIPLGGTAHACGTLIAGDDPANSVVDPQGRVHGMTQPLCGRRQRAAAFEPRQSGADDLRVGAASRRQTRPIARESCNDHLEPPQRRASAPGKSALGEGELAIVGPVSFRARLGHGARGL